jgi:MFS family permease
VLDGTDLDDSAGTPTPTSERLDPMLRRRWLLLFVTLVPLVWTWSLVNPMLASPDEPMHILTAQSIGRGDLRSPFTSDGLPVEAAECLKFQPETTAACQDLTWGPDGTELFGSTGDYPPLYHALAAVPTVFTSGLAGTYVMRLWMGTIVTALLAFAGALASRPGNGRWPLVGVMVAITPMAIFSMATVNPSGMTVASAALFVVAAISLLDSRWRGREVAIAAAVGAVGMALSRRDGLLWLSALGVVLAPLWIPRVRQLWHRRTPRATWTMGVVVVALGAVAFLWARPTIERFATSWQDGGGTSAWEAAKFLRGYLLQVVGILGWLDSPIGEEAYLAFLVTVGFVVIAGLVSDNRRRALATALGLIGLLLSPVIIGMIRFPYLQGRYLLPMWIGMTIAAGAAAAAGDTGERFDRRATSFVLTIWAIVHVVAGVQNLRRYAVGRSGPWDFVLDAEWQPPTMPNFAAVILYVAATAMALWGVFAVLRLDHGPSEPSPSESSPPESGPDALIGVARLGDEATRRTGG